MPSLDLSAPARLLGRNGDLRLLLAAGLVSMTGDWVLSVGIAYVVYAVTGSTLASAGALLSAFVPQVVVGSFAGVFVDRWDRKRTMIATNLLLAVGLLPLLLVNGVDRMWLVYVVLGLQACVEVFFGPAEQAFLPRVVAETDLVPANALNSQVRNVARLVGSALGGAAAAGGGLHAVALLDAATFLVGALLVARVRTDGRVLAVAPGAGEAVEVVRGRVRTLLEEWRVGFDTIAGEPVLRTLVIALLITSTGEGIMGTLFAPFVRHVLHGSGQAYGLITGVQAIGGVVGGFLVAALGARWSPVAMVWAGSVVFGLVDLAIFVYPLWWVTAWPAAAGMILVGFPGAVVVAGTMTLFQRHTTDERRGRVFSLLALAQGVSVVIGSGVAGVLGGPTGIIPVLAFQGVGYVVAGLLVLTRLGLRRASLDWTPTRS